MELKQYKLRLPLFINAVFALIFLVHATLIGYGIMYPDEPSQKIYTKDLSTFDSFPLKFKICVKEKSNPRNRYRKFGYDDIWAFYQGTNSLFGFGTWVGWGGHTKPNKSVEGTGKET